MANAVASMAQGSGEETEALLKRPPIVIAHQIPQKDLEGATSETKSKQWFDRKNPRCMTPLVGLRGLAALWIVVYHIQCYTINLDGEYAKMFPFFVEGSQMVSVFFILSGVSLVAFYDKEKLSSWARIRNFWSKRLARLAPLYYLGLLLAIPIAVQAYRNVHSSPGVITAESLLNVFFLKSIFWPSHTDGFVNWEVQLWQISAFMGCYCLYPLLINFKAGRNEHIIIATLCYAFPVICYFILAEACESLAEKELVKNSTPYGWLVGMHYWYIPRLPQFVLGMYLGNFLFNTSFLLPSGLAALLSDACLLAIASVTILFAYHEDRIYLWERFFQFLMVPVHMIFIMVLCHEEEQRRRGGCWRSISSTIFNSKPFQKLGELSLAIYCIHLQLFNPFVMLSKYPKIDKDWESYHYWIPVNLVLPFICVLIVASAVVHQVYEQPMKRLLVKWLTNGGRIK